MSQIMMINTLAQELSLNKAIPSASNIYKLGYIIYKSQFNIQNGRDKTNTLWREQHSSLVRIFQSLINTLPIEYLRDNIFSDIRAAFSSLVTSSKFQGLVLSPTSSDLFYELCKATQSLTGIFVISHSDKACEIGYNIDLCEQLGFFYDKISNISFGNDANQQEIILEVRECILSTLSSLYLRGLVLSHKRMKRRNNDLDYIAESTMKFISSLSNGHSRCLRELQQWQEKQKLISRNISSTDPLTIVDAIQALIPNESTQKDYLLLLLASDDIDPNNILDVNDRIPVNTNQKVSRTSSKHNQVATQISTSEAVDKLIQQVKDVLPKLGEGYIEAALACYNHDLETTTLALLEGVNNPSSLHPRLRVLDQSLPARRMNTKTKYDPAASSEEDKEARDIQKRHLKEMEKQGEDEAYLLTIAMQGDEYNDDYDDQYDGIGDDGGAAGGIGGADFGSYNDVDLDAIKVYNKVARNIHNESLFWEENQNLNRRKSNNVHNQHIEVNGDKEENTEEGAEESVKKYRGPDRGKKGRLIGPDGKYLNAKSTAKKAHGNGSLAKQEPSNNPSQGGSKVDGDNKAVMTNAQKRRKNDNKAKIGNHHRKERALKKTMM